MAHQEGQQYREITGFDGTFEEAVELGLVNKPPRLAWNAFQRWRATVGMRPTVAEDGEPPIPMNRLESKLYVRVMTAYYGPSFKEGASTAWPPPDQGAGAEGRPAVPSSGVPPRRRRPVRSLRCPDLNPVHPSIIASLHLLGTPERFCEKKWKRCTQQVAQQKQPQPL